MIRRLLPWPMTSLVLLAMWLLLNQTLSPGHILLGAALAIAVPRWTAPLRPVKAAVSRPGAALRLLGVVLRDSLMSNLEVARIILGPKARRHNSGFIKLPLTMRDAHGITTLAVVITAIPGTVCVELTDDRSCLLIHVLDLDDEQRWIDTLKNRYEKPLMEIFE
ncbi:Na(+)/H(+) antiporter subunit E1 [Pigmentiphaga humi]|uniref:Na(+)/H(+) antiporter subunit E1 n=1 Tax=Pigmentiphaga humi TaxID=2478468 RepID=A0A3P4B1D7_9BURK|nr:Na+/H+ antiporter subunit E [Pigmentiphaga humi]VCU69681.1 Na(+)/H(+) antiporter subunit E1 [Pigmentiphaga humi]